MRDAWAVLRKEVLEATGDRHSLRGPLLQAAITIGVCGLLVPALDSSIWTNVSATMVLYVIFPCTFAVTIAVDAFAGEMERNTLETLLATPLRDRSIFIGKAAAAVLFVLVVSAVTLLVGIATSFAFGRLEGPLPPQLFVGIFSGALAGSFLMASLAIGISVRVPVARSAQQIGSFLTFVIAGVIVAIIKHLGMELDWTIVLQADAVIFGLGVVGLVLAKAGFRRDRFFEGR